MNILSKTGIAVAAGVIIGMVALNSYTVVEDGTVKTQKFLGEISDDTYEAGLHIINPLSSFEEWDIKENMISEEITIPSQDKFKSNAKITIKWNMGTANLPDIQRTVGTQETVERIVITKPLDSILRSAGRKVGKAQDLFNETTVAEVQSYVYDALKEQAKPYGIDIQEVFISDITLDPVIQRAIVRTKELEEQEAQEQANLNKQKLIYARQTAEAEANAKSAAHAREAAQERSDARAYEIKSIADANLYAKQAEAKGNTVLAQSVTADLLKLKDVEVRMQTAQSWSGNVPSTIMGDASKVLPLYNINK